MLLHQKWFPYLVLSAGEVKDSEHFLYAEETKLAWEAGKLSADLTEEQRKLTEADLVIFQVQLRKRLTTYPESFWMSLFPPVPHVLVQCSCNHERLDWQGAHKGLCFFWGEALQPGCLQGKASVVVFGWMKSHLNFFCTCRTKKPSSHSPLVLKSQCSSRMVLMGTLMLPCGHCRYCTTKQAWNQQTGQFRSLTLLFSEWHSTLLRLPSSGPSNFLGSIFCFNRTTCHHAGRLARTAARPSRRRAPVVCSSGLLW